MKEEQVLQKQNKEKVSKEFSIKEHNSDNKKDYNWLSPFGVFFVILLSFIVYAGSFSTAAKAEYNPAPGFTLENLSWENGQPPSKMNLEWEKDGYKKILSEPGSIIAVKNSSVERLHSENGETIWSYKRPDSEICDVIGYNSIIYTLFNSGNGCNDITALDSATGEYVAQAQYGTQSDLGKLVGAEESIAIVTPHLVRLVRSSDLVPQATFGDTLTPIYDTDQEVKNCDISDVAIGEKVFAIASFCDNDDTYKVRLVEKEPEESSQGVITKTIDTASNRPVTLPIINNEQIIFVVQYEKYEASFWNIAEDEPFSVISYILEPGHIGYQHEEMSYFGYVWRIGDWVRYQASSEDLTKGKDVAGAIGKPILAGDKLLVPTYEGLAFVEFSNDEQYDIDVDIPVSDSFAFAGKTFIAHGEDGIIRAYQ